MSGFKLSLSFWLLYLVFPVGLWLAALIKFLGERRR